MQKKATEMICCDFYLICCFLYIPLYSEYVSYPAPNKVNNKVIDIFEVNSFENSTSSIAYLNASKIDIFVTSTIFSS